MNTSVPVSAATVGGTTYYQSLISSTSVSAQVLSPVSAPGYPMPTLPCYPFPPPMVNPAMLQAPSTVTIKDLAELLTFNKKDLARFQSGRKYFLMKVRKSARSFIVTVIGA